MLRAADVVIVPLVPTPLSLRMLRQLLDFIAREGWSDLVLLPFFSMVDRRRALHQELISSARAEFPQMLATEVPNWSEIERMSVRRAPLVATAPRGPAAQIYQQLWREIRGRTGAGDGERTPRASRARARGVAAGAALALKRRRPLPPARLAPIAHVGRAAHWITAPPAVHGRYVTAMMHSLRRCLAMRTVRG